MSRKLLTVLLWAAVIIIWLKEVFSIESNTLFTLVAGLAQWLLIGNDIAQNPSPMDAEEMEAWAQIRAEGVYSYVIVPGIIFPLGLMLWILAIILMAGASSMAYEPIERQIKIIGSYLLFILGVTCFFGVLRTLIWLQHQRRYKQAIKGAQRADGMSLK